MFGIPLYNFSISIHAPPRGATGFIMLSPPALQFQFTPLREGRPMRGILTREAYKFQFTPLREGRRCAANERREHGRISIHAPPRGATGLGDLIVEKVDISIHAPPRGATRHASYFAFASSSISIHAPPRGATAAFGRRRSPASYFNSRPSARGDLTARRVHPAVPLFQFTPLREGRPIRDEIKR